MSGGVDEREARADALPLYMQISELMIREIASGHLVDGQKLPPEREYARAHGTTVSTLRKALADLEAKGLLERRQGSGNYIRAGQVPASVYSMFRLEHADGRSGLPRARLLSAEYLPKDDAQPSYGRSNHGTRFRRVRSLDQTVIALEEIWLDGEAGRIPYEAVQESLYLTYKSVLTLWITRAEDRVGIAPVPDWAPPDFPLPQGQVTAHVERLSWAQDARAIEFSRTWFDTDRARYVQRLI